MRPLADAVIAILILVAPPALLTVWMLLLNVRDGRQAAIGAIAGACCRELGLRGMVAVDVSAALWTRRARVTIDMRLCNAVKVWRVVESLDTQLPPTARLRIIAAASSSTPYSISFGRDALAPAFTTRRSTWSRSV
jgi:hypothetical protein